jgi:para-nitrobenzyl esterase
MRLLSTVVLACLVAFAPPVTTAVQETVRLDSGLITSDPGADTSVRVFKGIPFAAAPVGALRWRPPAPVLRWDGVRRADQFPPTCPQPARTGALAQLATSFRLGPSSEDCLYLNIWTAARSATARLPVMVWLPGGAFTTGGGSGLVFDGESLAKRGVVLVTVNYRLGVMGFLAHPELTNESERRASGNYGLMDQIAALQWIQRNITAFGGDRTRITLFGQSAGASSVWYLMASPLAKGLFQRAIGQSAGGTAGLLALDAPLSRASAEVAGLRFATSIGVGSIAELRTRPFEQLVQKAGVASMAPIVDGWLLPEDPRAVFRGRRQHHMPLLVGSNADDGRQQPLTAEAYVAGSKERYGALFDAYMRLYPGATTAEANASQDAFAPDARAWRVWNWADLHARSVTSTFLYYFTRKAPAGAPSSGAYHGAELYYVFHNQHLYRQEWTAWDRTLADTMSSYWINFAARGDPNGRGLPQNEERHIRTRSNTACSRRRVGG